MSLVRETPPCHKLNIELPFPVDENNGNAKFDKSRKSLVVTLPIKPGAPVMKTERLSSNDSGIEMEESNGGVANNAAAEGCGHNGVSKKASSPNSDKINGKQNGEKMNKKEGYRTGGDNNNKKAKKATVKTTTVAKSDDDPACDDVKESSSEREVSPPDQMEVDSEASDNVIQQSKNDDNTGNMDDSTDNKNQDDQITNNNNHYRTKPGFLDSDMTYSLPTFTHTVLDNVMIVTLEVKNVSEETVAYARFDAWKSVHLKFSSVGAGYFPVQHAFYIDFLQEGCIEFCLMLLGCKLKSILAEKILEA